MNETPSERIGERILAIVKEVVDEYPDVHEDTIVEIIKGRCLHELGENELTAFYAAGGRASARVVR
jgi:RecA/RadA recombinase